MSDIKIQPSATGTATVTLTAPVTNTARTITFPDSTSTLLASDGSAANLTAIPAANITGTLPALSGANLTNLDAADVSGTHTSFTSTGIDDNADATAMTIDSSERIGIGAATSPNTLVHVKASSGSVLRVEETSGSYIDIEAGGSTGHIKSKSGHDITFSPGGNNHLQLYSSGRAKSQFTANAWCAFNAQTPAIRDSHNVSSLSDQATGWFYVNIDTDLANANSVAVASGSNANNTYRILCATAVQVVGSVYVMCSGASTGSSTAAFDPEFVNVVVFGD